MFTSSWWIFVRCSVLRNIDIVFTFSVPTDAVTDFLLHYLHMSFRYVTFCCTLGHLSLFSSSTVIASKIFLAAYISKMGCKKIQTQHPPPPHYVLHRDWKVADSRTIFLALFFAFLIFLFVLVFVRFSDPRDNERDSLSF